MTDVELVTAFLKALEAKDLDRMLGFMADDVHVHNLPIEPTIGRAAFRESTEAFMGSLKPAEMEIEIFSILADGKGYVVTERSDNFLVGGRWIKLPVAGAFEIVEGKIRKWREYFDMATFDKQMAVSVAAQG